MSTISKFVAGAAIAVVLAGPALADDARVWSRDSRFAVLAPAGARVGSVPRATVFTQGGDRVATARVTTALVPNQSRNAPYVESRSIGGRIVTGPMTRQETRQVATRLRRAATSPYSSSQQMDPAFLPAVIPYDGPYKAGTIVIDTNARYLYLVNDDGTARRYGVGVGRPGFEWAGAHKITSKREWPGWTPPAAMRERQPELPAYMEGGPDNPLGARAMYLGSSLYRIHGSNAPWTIGTAVSSGCIRMRNEDVTELYDLVKVGTKVIVL